MQTNHVEKALVNIVDRIEETKALIIMAEDPGKEKLLKKLNQLYIMRSYYIKLISQR